METRIKTDSELDPTLRLPPEVMECIWQYLDLKDLLNSLLVSTSWNRYLKLDPIWRKFCKKKSSKLSPWKLFYQERALDTSWKRGIFKEYAMEVSFQQINIGKKHIYLTEEKHLICFNATLKRIGSIVFPEKIHKLYTFGHYVCIVFKKSDKYFQVNIYKNMTKVAKFESTSDKIVTSENKICFKNEANLYLWTTAGETEEFHLPWEIFDFFIYNKRVVVKRRCNLSIIISISSQNNNGKWEDICTSSNRSPLGFSQVLVISDSKGIAILDIFQSDDHFSYSDLFIFGTNINYKLGDSKRQYFKCCFTDNSILFTDSWGHLISINLNNGSICKTKLNSPVDSILSCGNNFVLTFQNRWEFWTNESFKYSVKKGFPSTTLGVGKNFVFAVSGRTVNVWTFSEKQ